MKVHICTIRNSW